MSFAEPKQPHRRGGLPMAPMLDVIFLLLIFFVVTSSLHDDERRFDVELPSAEASEASDGRASQITINVREDGALMLGPREYEAAELGEVLRELVADYPDERVIIRGDRASRYERIVLVMDIARDAGVRHLYFATSRHGQEEGD